jgi:hypothetical protein
MENVGMSYKCCEEARCTPSVICVTCGWKLWADLEGEQVHAP